MKGDKKKKEGKTELVLECSLELESSVGVYQVSLHFVRDVPSVIMWEKSYILDCEGCGIE